MVLSLPLMIIPKADSVPLVMVGFFLRCLSDRDLSFCRLRMQPKYFRISQSGLIAGVGAGSWSAVVALVMPIFGRLFDEARYDDAFCWRRFFRCWLCFRMEMDARTITVYRLISIQFLKSAS